MQTAGKENYYLRETANMFLLRAVVRKVWKTYTRLRPVHSAGSAGMTPLEFSFAAIRNSRDTTHRRSLAKVKFNFEQATKAQRGSRGIALLFS